MQIRAAEGVWFFAQSALVGPRVRAFGRQRRQVKKRYFESDR